MLVSILILFTACHGEESEMMASDGPINLRGPVNLRETAQNDSDAFRFLVIGYIYCKLLIKQVHQLFN